MRLPSGTVVMTTVWLWTSLRIIDAGEILLVVGCIDPADDRYRLLVVLDGTVVVTERIHRRWIEIARPM